MAYLAMRRTLQACAWSVGVLAQRLCTHTLPFKGSDVQQLLAAITAGRGKASTPPPLWMSDQGKAFITAALQQVGGVQCGLACRVRGTCSHLTRMPCYMLHYPAYRRVVISNMLHYPW